VLLAGVNALYDVLRGRRHRAWVPERHAPVAVGPVAEEG